MKESNENIKHEFYLNALRAFSAIAVIVIHVSANNWYGHIGSFNWYVFTIYEGISKVAVPLFFMISGGLLLDKKYSLKKIYLKIFKLVIFLVFWAFVYKIIQLPVERRNYAGVKNSIKEILYGDTQTHLWFVYSIIGLYVITPILYNLVHSCSYNELLYAIAIIFFLDNLPELLNLLGNMDVLINNINRIKSGFSFGYIGYYLLGYYLKKKDFSKNKRIVIYIMGVQSAIALVLLVVIDCIKNQRLLERYWSYTMPLMVLYSCAFFIFFKNITWKNQRILKVLDKISEYSLGIYGVHFVFIIILWKVGFTTFTFNSLLSVPFISMSVLCCSYVAAAFLRKIPIINKFL